MKTNIVHLQCVRSCQCVDKKTNRLIIQSLKTSCVKASQIAANQILVNGV
uniref:Uncharacterized protein n=1 Tax=Anguilla anguilla TaxID=7936 RepID=A0A0E9XAH4_ANGAN